jgi:hypothetical protein
MRSGDANAPRCGFVKADGQPCRVTMGLSPITGHCIAHDLARRDEWTARRSAGGRASNEARKRERRRLPARMPPRPETLADAVKYAAWLVWAVNVGEIDARTCEASTKALRQFQLGEEKRALEEKIKQLRAELAEARRERPRFVS